MTREVAKRPAFEPPGQLARPSRHDPRMPRPIATVTGAALVVLRVAAGIAWLVALATEWDAVLRQQVGDQAADSPNADTALTIILAVGAAILLVDLILAVLIFFGLNWPRILVMFFATLSISGTFASWWAGDQAITLDETFLTLGLDILIMLALSSRAARDYARRKEPQPEPAPD